MKFGLFFFFKKNEIKLVLVVLSQLLIKLSPSLIRLIENSLYDITKESSSFQKECKALYHLFSLLAVFRNLKFMADFSSVSSCMPSA